MVGSPRLFSSALIALAIFPAVALKIGSPSIARFSVFMSIPASFASWLFDHPS
jgi:hypothetical protein